MDPTAEALTQEPGHQWETGGASNQVDTGDVGQVRTAASSLPTSGAIVARERSTSGVQA